MKEKIAFTILLIVLLIGCNSQPSTPTSTSIFATGIAPSKSATIDIPTVTPVPPLVTSAPKPTQTLEPDRLVNKQDKQDKQEFISSRYGFTITFPTDMEIRTKYSNNNALVAGYLPQKHLADGGDIVTWIEVIVKNQENDCRPILKDTVDEPTEEKQETLGTTSFTRIYTPSLYGDYMQSMEYMTYSADFCIHIYVNLTTYYFDQGNAMPSDMIPYVQDELDGIVSTFQWINP